MCGRLRELSNFEKQENQRLQKQTDAQKSEMTSLTKDREKLQKDVAKLETEIIELKEMVRSLVFCAVVLFFDTIDVCEFSNNWFT